MKHLKCWLWKGLWGVSALSFLLSWAIVIYGSPLFGLDPLLLLWTALVLGVLSIPVKLDCQNCTTCQVPSARM